MKKINPVMNLCFLVIMIFSLAFFNGCARKADESDKKIKDTKKKSISSQDNQQIKKLLVKAKNLKMADKKEEALEQYNEILKIDPNHSEALQETGSLLIELKKYDEAEAILKKLIKIDPDNYNGHLLLSKIYHKQGKMNDFLKHQESAYKLRSHTLDGNLEYGIAMTVAGNNKKAVDYLQGCLRFKPDKTKRESIYRMIGIAYRNMGNLEKSKEYLNKAVKLGQGERLALSYVNLMDIYSDQDRLDKVIDTLKKLEKINGHKKIISRMDDSTRSTMFKSMGDVYLNDSKFEKAIEYFSKSLQIKEDAQTYHKRAQAYFSVGKVNEARQDIRKWRKLAPQKPIKTDDFSNFAIAYFIEGNVDKAIELTNYLINKDHKNFSHYGKRAVFYYWKGDTQSFKKDFDRFKENSDKDAVEEVNKVIKTIDRIKSKSTG